MIFGLNTSGVVVAPASLADRYTGGVVKWEAAVDDCNEHMKPTAQTWDKTLAGRLSFVVDVTAGDYDLLSLVSTQGMQSWFWVEVNRVKNLVGPEMQGRFLYSSTELTWLVGENNSIALNDGLNTIDIYSISASVYLEAIALVPAGNETIANGDTSGNYPDYVATGDDPIIDTDSFVDWMRDRTRDQHRTLLIKLSHADGMLRLSSLPYHLSEHHYPFYGWIKGSPYLEIGLESSNIGKVEAVCFDLTMNWLNHEWRGGRCEWYFGDDEWPEAKFKHIASATIKNCYPTADRVYSFEIISDAAKYNTTFYKGVTGEVAGSVADVTRTETAQSAIAWLMSQFENAGAYQFLNVPSDAMNKQIEYTVTESSNMNTLLRKIVRSIGAQMRMTQTGFMEIVIPDTGSAAGVYIQQDNVLHDGLRAARTIDPVQRVITNYGDDLSTTSYTEASTGTLDEEVEIDTFLVNEADAQALGDAEAILYQRTRRAWSIEVDGLGAVIQAADFLTIEHEQLTSSGVVGLVRLEPLSRITQLEATM